MSPEERRAKLEAAASAAGLDERTLRTIARWDGTGKLRLYELMMIAGAETEEQLAEDEQERPWGFDFGSQGVLLRGAQGQRLKVELERLQLAFDDTPR